VTWNVPTARSISRRHTRRVAAQLAGRRRQDRPIAHKGELAGAKVLAASVLDS